MAVQVETLEAAFAELFDNWPEAGSVIGTKDGRKIRLIREPRGEKNAYFVRMAIDAECTGWYLDENPRGVVCMIHDSQRERASRTRTVSRLRVLRRMLGKGRGLICTIEE